jgi:hypothetical protein
MTGTDRLIRDGQVAVLYTASHGGGWSTWNLEWAQAMMFDPQIADIVDRGDLDWQAQALAIALLKYPDAYLSGLKNLRIVWIPQGTDFRITEYDGLESVELRDRLDWIRA